MGSVRTGIFLKECSATPELCCHLAIHQGTAGGIHHDGAPLHGGEPPRIQPFSRPLPARHMHGEDIDGPQEVLVVVVIGGALLQLRRQAIKVAVVDFHTTPAERSAYSGSLGSRPRARTSPLRAR